MMIRQRFPAGPDRALPDLLDEMAADVPGGPLVVGDPRVVDFLTSFGRTLLEPALIRRHPELAPLGFFLRRAELDAQLARLTTADTGAFRTLRFPRGLVFHIPPANVDTIFVYAWALAALTGNRNIVRVSPRSGPAAEVILDRLTEALADAHPALAATQRMITYDRDDRATEALSAACDLRVVWGGDHTVAAVRRTPLPPAARDLAFPDRSSFAVVSAGAWLAADDEQREQVVLGLHNDSYWFDQAACASPRALFWVGDEAPATEARRDLFARLAQVIAERGGTPEPAMAVHKRVAAYGEAAGGRVTRVSFAADEALAVLDLADPLDAPRDWLGAGTFPTATVARLADLAPILRRRDQTLTHFGFTEAELAEFARGAGGRGIDRIVPIGAALSFAPIWDGYDLPREFTRLTTIAAPPARARQ
ncbi:MAG TPA: acyl-CoA reductase [Yinghuangia sp.]|uniref:acyl-CoA reductase n=1 Tax=Yinghuangia sp. YIM S10712 TaxID=3436930 RepID=UPI002C1143D8|nr:acyl-CoA reductase [Yinghuangia sp.]